MKKYWPMIVKQWRQLQPRERMVLGAGLAIVVVVVLFTYVWMPVAADAVSSYQQLKTKKQQLTYMQHAAKRIDSYLTAGLTLNRSVSSDVSISVKQAVKQERLSVYQSGFTASGKGSQQSVTLTFNSVPFDRFIHMTQNLWSKQAIYISSFTLDSLKTSGLVQIQATFKAS